MQNTPESLRTHQTLSSQGFTLSTTRRHSGHDYVVHHSIEGRVFHTLIEPHRVRRYESSSRSPEDHQFILVFDSGDLSGLPVTPASQPIIEETSPQTPARKGCGGDQHRWAAPYATWPEDGTLCLCNSIEWKWPPAVRHTGVSIGIKEPAPAATRCTDCGASWSYENEHEKELATEALWSHACQSGPPESNPYAELIEKMNESVRSTRRCCRFHDRNHLCSVLRATGGVVCCSDCPTFKENAQKLPV